MGKVGLLKKGAVGVKKTIQTTSSKLFKSTPNPNAAVISSGNVFQRAGQRVSGALAGTTKAITGAFKGTPLRIAGYATAGAAGAAAIGIAGGKLGQGISRIRQGFGYYTDAENLQAETDYLGGLTEYYQSGGGASGIPYTPYGEQGGNGLGGISLETWIIILVAAVIGYFVLIKDKKVTGRAKK